MPLVSWFVKAMNCLPVYRKQDGANTADNGRTLDAARAILAKGGAIALFPEGTSHSDPKLKPLKTGAARLALGAAADGANIQIIPVGLHYTDKAIFRSDALMTYGAPIDVPRVILDDNAEPPREAALLLTEQIRAGLNEVTVQAESTEFFDLLCKAESLFTAASSGEEDALADRATILREFSSHYDELKDRVPKRLWRLRRRIESHFALLSALKLRAGHPDLHDFTPGNVVGYTLRNLVMLILCGPLALLGWVWHMPAYYTVRAIAFLSKGDTDQRATIKLIAALLLFPASWIAVGLALGLLFGWVTGLCVGLSGPFLGYIVLHFKERVERIGLATRALTVFLTRRRHLERLSLQRSALRNELLALRALVDERDGNSSDVLQI
jgi:hypothetical protein